MDAEIDSIIVGQRFRKDFGDIQSLAEDIADIGLLQPIGITRNNVLVFGERRLRAFKLLGRSEIPVRVVDIASLLKGEYSENALRKDFTISERVEIGRALEADLRTRVGRPSEETKEIFPELPKGQTRDIAADKAGFGNGKTYEQAKNVIDEAAAPIVKAMDDGLISINLASKIAALPQEERAVVEASPPEEMKEVAREAIHNHRAQGTGENEWYTPAQYVDSARLMMGGIDVDPASSELAQQTVQAGEFFTIDDDGLQREWNGRVWLNPPYAQPAIQHFMQKTVDEFKAGRMLEGIALTHNYTDTQWFHLAAKEASAICFTRGRIGFLNPEGKKAAPTQGQAFFYFGGRQEDFADEFCKFGFVMVKP